MTISCIVDVGAEQYYSCDLTKRIPVRVSIVTINGDTGFGIVESLEMGEESIREYIDELTKSKNIKSVIVTHRAPDAYWTRVVHKVTSPSIYETILESGCMTYLPIIIEKGIQTHRVLAPTRAVLGEMLHLLRERFSFVRIRQVRSRPFGPSGAILTQKQREAVHLAVDFGYYSIPRSCTIEHLAQMLGIRRVAMQERLRRAEQRIIASFVRR